MTNPTACPACYAPLAPDARYCHRCGRAVTAGGLAERAPWFIAWAVVGPLRCRYRVLRHAQARRAGPAGHGERRCRPAEPPPGESPPAGGPGQPPDISQMTPRERFTRLYDRIMTRGRTGRHRDGGAVLADGLLRLRHAGHHRRRHALPGGRRCHVQLGQFPSRARPGRHHPGRREASPLRRPAPGPGRGAQEGRGGARPEPQEFPGALRRRDSPPKRPEYDEQQAALDAFKAQSGPK